MTQAVKFAEHSDGLGRTFGQASCKSSLGRTLYEGSVIFFLCSVAARSARGFRGSVVRRLAEASYKSRLGLGFGQVSANDGRRLEEGSAVADVSSWRLALRANALSGLRPQAAPRLGLRFRSLTHAACGSSSLCSTASGRPVPLRGRRRSPRGVPSGKCSPRPSPSTSRLRYSFVSVAGATRCARSIATRKGSLRSRPLPFALAALACACGLRAGPCVHQSRRPHGLRAKARGRR
ncbi:hypothetical protein PMI12_02382 [Variovorax sp. CF313]|nr:hypothetical protein PMI12_02382 [Variovorax sp. CF313]